MPGKAKQAAVKTFSSLINGLILMERMKNILGIYSGGSGAFRIWTVFCQENHAAFAFKTIPEQVNAIVVWGQRPSAQNLLPWRNQRVCQSFASKMVLFVLSA
jgi:hypothetical protein